MNNEDVAVMLANHDNRIKVSEKRIADLERVQGQIQELTVSVKEMAISLKTMVEEQKEQSQRIKALEEAPVQRWKDSTKALFNALLGSIGTAIGGALLYLVAQFIMK